jgi:hypothetical protein
MSFLARLLGRSAPSIRRSPHGPRSAFRTSRTSGASHSPSGIHRELLRLVLRETLRHTGIPGDWVAIDPLGMKRPDRGSGVHVRLVIRHWDERFLRYLCAFQQDFTTRLQSFDPAASQWLLGVSWQFELGTGDDWPDLPPRSTWQNEVPRAEAPLRDSPDLLMATVPLSREELRRQTDATDQRYAARRGPVDFAPTQTLPPRDPG